MVMGALKELDVSVKVSGNSEAPVDLVYLSSLTMGDVSLESEILGMFAAQLPNYLSSLRDCDGEQDRKVALHTLKGAARSIGARRLSELAKDMEEDGSLTLNALLKESERVAEYIASISS